MKIFTLLFWRDAGERAGTAFGIQAFTIIAAGGISIVSVTGLPYQLIIISGAGAAIVSLITTIVLYLLSLQALGFWPDLGLRTLKAFGSSLLGTVGAVSVDHVITISWVHALDVAAVAAVLTVGKGFLARGSADSASVSTTVRAHLAVAK